MTSSAGVCITDPVEIIRVWGDFSARHRSSRFPRALRQKTLAGIDYHSLRNE